MYYPERIVCLTEETTETLYLLGEEDRIVGISGFTVRPERARKEKPKVSAFIEADIPKIEALKPDLVLAFSDIQADITQELVKRGHTVMTFNQRSIAEILRAVVTIGSLVGKQEAAESLAERLRNHIEEIRIRGDALPKRKRVFFEEWPDPLISGIRWVSELIEIAGGADVCCDVSHCSLAKDRILEPEAVAAKNPELVIASWCGKKVRREDIASRPGWGNTDAVRLEQIYEVNSSIILQPGPAALTDGLDELHRILAGAAVGS